MSRYAQGGDLTQFNTGGLHSQNALGGIPIGNNNSVEQGETKQDNFIYSNRIFLDEGVISRYSLPKSLVGKSVADATKYIDTKFKGRNDKISQSTKNGMLSKIAEAQESMKPQEPEIEQQGYSENIEGSNQMALGGFEQYNTIDPNAGVGYKYDPTANLAPTINTNDYTSHLNNQSSTNNINNQDKYVNAASALARPIADSLYSSGDEKRSSDIQSINAVGQGVGSMVGGAAGSNISKGVTAATGLYEMGSEAFGKSNIKTSGERAITGANAGKSAGAGALKGAGTGAAIGSYIGPWGTVIGAGVGALVGGVSGFVGGKKDEKAQFKNNDRYALNTNKQNSDQYALGGELNNNEKKLITKEQLSTTSILPNTNPVVQTDRFRYAVGEQSGVQHGTSGEQGHYLYYGKKPGEPGFNPNVNREFVNQGGYDTYMKSPQGQQYRRNLSTQSLQPIEQLGCGGKINKMADGGWYDKNKPYFMTNSGPIIQPTIGKTGFYGPDVIPKQIFNNPTESINIPEQVIKPTQTQAQFENYANQNQTIIPSFGQKVGKTINDNLGNIARYAPIAANAYQLSQLKKPQGERLDRLDNRYKPEYVDEAALQNIADQTMNNSIAAVGQSGASQGQLRSSIIGSQLQRTKALSDAYNQAAAQNRATNDRAQTFNLGVDQVNLNQSNTEKENFAKDKGNYDTQKSKLIGQLGNDVGNVGKEEIYKKIAKTTTGYNWLGEYQKANPNATPEETKEAAKKAGMLVEDDKIVKKQALGGYLIKNKIK